jgi:hypothetical protein
MQKLQMKNNFHTIFTNSLGLMFYVTINPIRKFIYTCVNLESCKSILCHVNQIDLYGFTWLCGKKFKCDF